MTEKIPILNDGQIDTVYPFAYNYEDFAGKDDWSNMFVTTLMQTKRGNCHSLPYLYKIIMDELGEESYLSLCPNHLYIKAQNEKMGWYNIELTNRNFPTDAYLMSSGYVHIDAIRNGIYMNELTRQESVALCLVDLAQGYIAKFGVGDGEFVLKCCETTLQYFPDCITALLLKSRVLAESYQNSDIKSDEQFAELTELTTKIHKLGYRKMPDRMYQNCLARMQSEGRGNWYGVDVNLTAAQANTKNPFAEYGFDKSIMIRSASETIFEEFFDLEDTVELGSVYFNIRTHEITGFIPDEKLQNEINVDLIALSVDPKAHLYWWLSPYVYCGNNPISRIDPNGESDFSINRRGEIKLLKETDSETDQLIALNRKGEVRYNKDGTAKRSIEVSKGVLQGGEDSRMESPNGYTKMELSDSKEAWKVFSFASRNTDVEFSLMGVKSGGGESHLITTSHDKGFDNYGSTEAGKYANNGGLLYHFHNHFNSFRPSDYGSQGGDIPFMKRMTAPGKSPNAVFGIFYGGKLFNYSGNRIRKDGSKIQ